MTRESYRTEYHNSRAGLAHALRRHSLSNRAARLLIGLLGECDENGVFHKHLSYAADWSEQSDDTIRSGLKELLRSGLVCKHPVFPRAYCLDPSLWFSGSKRQLARHIRMFERQKHGLPPEESPLH